MRKIIALILIPLVLVILFVGNFLFSGPDKNISPLARNYKKPLDTYTFDALKKRTYTGSEIRLIKKRADTEKYVSYSMSFLSDSKKVSGFIAIPKNTPEAPVILTLRGYVDRENYATGVGSESVATALVNNGYVVLSPDFLGYGDSDRPSSHPLEERFQTYTTVLNLLESIKTLNSTLSRQPFPIKIQENSVGIWAHSNGGHIALSVLAISGKNYPTALWAPVSKPFPYSILYFTDDSDDHGKAMRKLVSVFESEYDAELYSTTNYLKWIKAPIQLHQGTADEAVPQSWSDTLYTSLDKIGVSVDYFTYEGADHNLSPNSWNSAVDRMVGFFKATLK